MHTRYDQRTKHLINVAQGKEKAHLVVRNSTLVNVYTGELLKNQAICIWDHWIAYAGPDPDPAIGPDTIVIDAEQKPVAPGFIDGHTHMAVMYTADNFLVHAIAGGTTTIVTETSEPCFIGGYAGIVDFMASLANQPIHFFGTVPPLVGISPCFPPIPINDFSRLINREDIVGLGEAYWQGAVNAPECLLPLLDAAWSSGKAMEGHSAGANRAKLNAYASLGFTSCHEPIKAQEALDRARLGFYVMIREGSIRRDLAEIANILKTDVDRRRMILVTDSITPDELLTKGYMEYVVQKAIDCGFSPMEAIQMATLNPATHFKLDHLIGGLAPGRFADLIILPDIGTIRPELVICKGRIIARDGQCLVPPRAHQFAPESLDSVRLKAPLTAADFKISGPPDATKATVRVIDMVTDLVTHEAHIDLPVDQGEIKIDTAQDIVKLAAINRVNAPGKLFVGLIRGFNLQTGALATSTAWDAGNILVAGASETDMALAVNRIDALKGGIVVCRNGEIIAELALPIWGLLTDLPVSTLAENLETIKNTALSLGISFRDPVLSLSTLTSAAIPFIKCCEQGLVNLKTGPCPLFIRE